MKVISDATDPNPREHEQAFYSRGTIVAMMALFRLGRSKFTGPLAYDVRKWYFWAPISCQPLVMSIKAARGSFYVRK